MTLFGASGGRKSLLALFLVLQVVRRGEHVRYLDRENRWQEVVKRLKKMGATPDELQRFDYRTLAATLVDTEKGQARVLELSQGMALVVFDSWARFFASGNQSDEGPANQAYNGLLLPLRGRETGVLRLDHSGVKETARPSGTVVKLADADHLWMVSTKGERTTLTHNKNRPNVGPAAIVLDWLEGPLRAVAPTGGATATQEAITEATTAEQKVAACVAVLDGMSVDPGLGRGEVVKMLVAAGYTGKAGFSTDTVRQAINARRTAG